MRPGMSATARIGIERVPDMLIRLRGRLSARRAAGRVSAERIDARRTTDRISRAAASRSPSPPVWRPATSSQLAARNPSRIRRPR